MNTSNFSCFGRWQVWDGKPPPRNWQPDIDAIENYHCVGTFLGFVDDIALQLDSRARDAVFHFRPAANEASLDELKLKRGPVDSRIVAVEVELLDGESLAQSKSDIAMFFHGRPVVADVVSNSCVRAVRITYLESESGRAMLEAKQALDAVLAKLTAEDIQVLERQGLCRYTYAADFPDY